MKRMDCFQEALNDSFNNGKLKGKLEGKSEGITEMIKSMLKDGSFTVEEISEISGWSKQKITEIKEEISV